MAVTGMIAGGLRAACHPPPRTLELPSVPRAFARAHVAVCHPPRRGQGEMRSRLAGTTPVETLRRGRSFGARMMAGPAGDRVTGSSFNTLPLYPPRTPMRRVRVPWCARCHAPAAPRRGFDMQPAWHASPACRTRRRARRAGPAASQRRRVSRPRGIRGRAGHGAPSRPSSCGEIAALSRQVRSDPPQNPADACYGGRHGYHAHR